MRPVVNRRPALEDVIPPSATLLNWAHTPVSNRNDAAASETPGVFHASDQVLLPATR